MLPITVIIPIYNHEGYIEQCLRSISQSAEQPAEIVLVDNGSTDGSVDRAAALGLQNLTIIRNAENVGATRARYIGSQRAMTRYLTFLDSDDMLGPEALGQAHQALCATGADVSLFKTMRISEDGLKISPFIDVPEPKMTGIRAFELSLGHWAVHAYGLFETACYRQAMADFECHGFSDDEVLARHLFLAAGSVCASEGLHFYREVHKPYTLEKVIKQTKTNLRVLGLAATRRAELSSDRPLRDMRNIVTRNLAGLIARLLRDGGDWTEVRKLYREYSGISVPWRASDARSLALHAACAMALQFRRKSG